MNRSQVMDTIADWDSYRENEMACDRAMDYLLDGRL